MTVPPPTVHQVLVSRLIGGAAVVAIRLAAAVARRDIPSVAWVPGTGPASDALAAAGVNWRTYDLERMKGRALPQLWASARMAGALGVVSRPIVHVHNPTVYRLLRPALVAARARTVVHFQIEPSKEEIRWSMRYPPDCIVACARYIADAIASELEGVRPAPRIVAAPNSIDIERFTPSSCQAARQQVGIPTTRFVLLMMANLAPHKGQETALGALQLLTTRGVDAECWLAGEDRAPGQPYETELRRLAEDTGISDRVRFLGFRSDGPDLLRSADVLLLPSKHEGLPLIVLEAQAAEVPVVASTIPGVAEVIQQDRTGCLVPADDVGGYADAIQRLISDRELRDRLTSAAAHQVRRHHTWAQFERAMFEIYGSLSPAITPVLSARAAGGTSGVGLLGDDA